MHPRIPLARFPCTLTDFAIMRETTHARRDLPRHKLLIRTYVHEVMTMPAFVVMELTGVYFFLSFDAGSLS